MRSAKAFLLVTALFIVNIIKPQITFAQSPSCSVFVRQTADRLIITTQQPNNPTNPINASISFDTFRLDIENGDRSCTPADASGIQNCTFIVNALDYPLLANSKGYTINIYAASPDNANVNCSSNEIVLSDFVQAADPLATTDPNDFGFDNYTLNDFNPLVLSGSPQAEQLSTPRGVISRVLEFAFPLAGMILFVMIVWGGFEILSKATSKKSLDAGKQRVTAAIIGFILLFSSYWIVKIIEIVLDVPIL